MFYGFLGVLSSQEGKFKIFLSLFSNVLIAPERTTPALRFEDATHRQIAGQPLSRFFNVLLVDRDIHVLRASAIRGTIHFPKKVSRKLLHLFLKIPRKKFFIFLNSSNHPAVPTLILLILFQFLDIPRI